MNLSVRTEGSFLPASLLSWSAVAILAIHAVVVTTLRGFRVEPLSSGFLQVIASLVLTAACYRASKQQGTGFARRFWFLVGSTSATWTAAQVLDVVNEFYLHSIDINPSSILLLFFIAITPLTFTLFQQMPEKRSATRWVWIADALQLLLLIGCAVFAYMAMAESTSGLALTVGRLQVLHWRNLVMSIALVMRACSLRGEAKRLFAILAMSFSLYAVSSLFGNWALEVWEVGTGTWFDLAWTVPFAMLAVCAAEWKSVPTSSEKPMIDQTELPVPGLLSFGVISIAAFHMRSHPLVSPLVTILSVAILLSRTYFMAGARVQELELMPESAVPICAGCKMIRDGAGNWNPFESYIRDSYGVEFSHGICELCVRALYPEHRLE